jgi:hypothetical protein
MVLLLMPMIFLPIGLHFRQDRQHLLHHVRIASLLQGRMIRPARLFSVQKQSIRSSEAIVMTPLSQS